MTEDERAGCPDRVEGEQCSQSWLFNPEAGEDWTMEDDHLAKMMELTGQRFPPSMLERAKRRNEYFDDAGMSFRRAPRSAQGPKPSWVRATTES